MVIETHKAALTEALCSILNIPPQNSLEFMLINDRFTKISPNYQNSNNSIIETNELQLNA